MGRGESHEPLLIDHRIQFTERKFRILDNLLFPSSRGMGLASLYGRRGCGSSMPP